MVTRDAGDGVEMLHARPEGSGRKRREQGTGASIATAGSTPFHPEVDLRLMERIVSRENMMAAYRRVMANRALRASTG
jgi:RNA-directed DNA polymerase